MKNKLIIATRKSELALWQANHVAGLLRELHKGLEVELLPMVTQGDIILDRPLAQIGGKGLFLKELERALLREEADIAVHSMKDVPMEDVAGLADDDFSPTFTGGDTDNDGELDTDETWTYEATGTAVAGQYPVHQAEPFSWSSASDALMIA